MPHIEDFFFSNIISSAAVDESNSFHESLVDLIDNYRSDLSVELDSMRKAQQGITKQMADVDRLAQTTLGATQARIAHLQSDLYNLRHVNNLALAARKTQESIANILESLQQIDSVLPPHERLCPQMSPHKKHYPRLHLALQKNSNNSLFSTPDDYLRKSTGRRRAKSNSSRAASASSGKSRRSLGSIEGVKPTNKLIVEGLQIPSFSPDNNSWPANNHIPRQQSPELDNSFPIKIQTNVTEGSSNEPVSNDEFELNETFSPIQGSSQTDLPGILNESEATTTLSPTTMSSTTRSQEIFSLSSTPASSSFVLSSPSIKASSSSNTISKALKDTPGKDLEYILLSHSNKSENDLKIPLSDFNSAEPEPSLNQAFGQLREPFELSNLSSLNELDDMTAAVVPTEFNSQHDSSTNPPDVSNEEDESKIIEIDKIPFSENVSLTNESSQSFPENRNKLRNMESTFKRSAGDDIISERYEESQKSVISQQIKEASDHDPKLESTTKNENKNEILGGNTGDSGTLKQQSEHCNGLDKQRIGEQITQPVLVAKDLETSEEQVTLPKINQEFISANEPLPQSESELDTESLFEGSKSLPDSLVLENKIHGESQKLTRPVDNLTDKLIETKTEDELTNKFRNNDESHEYSSRIGLKVNSSIAATGTVIVNTENSCAVEIEEPPIKNKDNDLTTEAEVLSDNETKYLLTDGAESLLGTHLEISSITKVKSDLAGEVKNFLNSSEKNSVSESAAPSDAKINDSSIAKINDSSIAKTNKSFVHTENLLVTETTSHFSTEEVPVNSGSLVSDDLESSFVTKAGNLVQHENTSKAELQELSTIKITLAAKEEEESTALTNSQGSSVIEEEPSVDEPPVKNESLPISKNENLLNEDLPVTKENLMAVEKENNLIIPTKASGLSDIELETDTISEIGSPVQAAISSNIETVQAKTSLDSKAEDSISGDALIKSALLIKVSSNTTFTPEYSSDPSTHDVSASLNSEETQIGGDDYNKYGDLELASPLYMPAVKAAPAVAATVVVSGIECYSPVAGTFSVPSTSSVQVSGNIDGNVTNNDVGNTSASIFNGEEGSSSVLKKHASLRETFASLGVVAEASAPVVGTSSGSAAAKLVMLSSSTSPSSISTAGPEQDNGNASAARKYLGGLFAKK